MGNEEFKDTVEREETVDGGCVFTFRVVVPRYQLELIDHLYLFLQDRLRDLIIDVESELILEREVKE